MRSLQRLLANSLAAKLLAVQRVSSNRGKNTPGVHGVLLNTPARKWRQVTRLSHNPVDRRVLHGAFSRLEPCAVKVASTVLRGRGDRKVTPLPDGAPLVAASLACNSWSLFRHDSRTVPAGSLMAQGENPCRAALPGGRPDDRLGQVRLGPKGVVLLGHGLFPDCPELQLKPRKVAAHV